MGRVFLAQDMRESGQLLALKTLAPEAENHVDVSHLSREFLALADLDHPHLIKVYDFDHVRHVVGEAYEGEPDDDLPAALPFFTSEFVSGAPILTATARLPLTGTLRLLLELTSALAYLHRQDLLHRDLTPENVLVADGVGDRQSRVKLLDLGLVARKGTATVAAGNPRYLAPELLHGAAADTRSELYALGLILYEVFARRPAFEGTTLPELARAQSSQAAPPLPDTVPQPVREVIAELLERDPARRPAILDVERALQTALAAPDRPTAFRGALGSPKLTGRDREIAFLEQAAHSMAHPDPAAVSTLRTLVLSGSPGIGKSRLIQVLRHRAQVEGLRYLSASCQQDADAFSGIRALLRPLLLERPDLVTPEREVLRTVLADRPTFRIDARAPDLSPRQAMVRIFDGVRMLLEAAALEQPLVVVLEDLHWADPESLELFHHLVLHLSDGRILLVGTCWPPAQTNSPLDRLLADLPLTSGQAQWIELEGLDQAAVRVLLARAVGMDDPPDALVERLRAQTDGNPLFLEEILKLSRGVESLEDLLGGSLLPQAVSEAFRVQILALSEDALTALKGLAVWGSAAPSLDLCAVTRQDRSECLTGLEEAAAAQLVRWHGSGYWFWHNVLVQIVDEVMSPQESAEFHRRAGRRREASTDIMDPERIGRLVTHFSRAGDASRALGYALSGARLAEERFLARRALELYESARDLGLEAIGRTLGGTAGLIEVREKLAHLYARTGAYARAEAEAHALLEDIGLHWDRPARTRLLSLLGDIATRRGDLEIALARFDAALESTTDPLAAAEILARTAEVHLKRSRLDETQAACDEALNRLGTADAPVLRGNIASQLGKSAQQRADFPAALEHFAAARALYARAGYLPGVAATQTAIAQVYIYQVQYRQAREAFLEALQLQEQQGDVEGVAVTLDRLALATWGMQEREAAITYGRRSLEVWRRLGNAQGEAKAVTTLGIIYHSQGAYGDALDSVNAALELQRQAGDSGGLLASYQNLGILYFEVGALDEAQAALASALELARASDSKLREARCHHILGGILAARGDTRRARAYLDRALEVFRGMGNKERLSDLLSGFVEVDLQEKDMARARRHADEAVELVSTLEHNPVLVQASMVRARVALAEPGSDLMAVLRDLEKATSLAGELNNPDLMWQLWEVKGRVALRMGRPRDAVRLLTRSMDVIQNCFKQLPERLKPVYIADPRRQAVRRALEQAVATLRGPGRSEQSVGEERRS